MFESSKGNIKHVVFIVLNELFNLDKSVNLTLD